MATIYYLGTATKTAQQTTVTPANVQVGDIFRILIGGIVVAQYTAAAATVADVCAGLTAAFNSTTAYPHLWKQKITATNNSTHVLLTSTVAGLPFTITTSHTDGGGTNNQTLTASTTVPNSSPNDWSVAANWSGGAVPVNSDVVIIKDISVPILWGLGQSAVTLSGLYIHQTFSGKIGLDYRKFAINADDTDHDTGITEYRPTQLQIKVNGPVVIGELLGTGAAAGSGRIILDLSTQATTINVINTAATTSDAGRPAVRIKCASASTDLFVQYAPGGVGVATEIPGETSTIRKVSISDITQASRVFTGPGTTITTWEQSGGNNTLQAASTVTQIIGDGGTLTTDGDFTATELSNNGMTCYPNHIKTSGNAITVCNPNRGITDFTKTTRARTVGTFDFSITEDGTLVTNDSVTWGAVTRPAGKTRMTFA